MKKHSYLIALQIIASYPLGRSQSSTSSSTPPFPRQRFVVFAELSSDQSTAATSLGYEETLWNVPGTFDLESHAYDAIVANMSIPNFETNAAILGFSEPDVWDCWQNHYQDYNWTELESVGVQQYWITLGFTTESQWNSTTYMPETDELFWVELTAEQQQAARQLCYIQGSWDELPLILYDLSEFQTLAPGNNSTNSNTLVPTLSPITMSPTKTGNQEIVKPDFRYVPWSQLDKATRDAAESLAYTMDTWNEPGMAVIEELDWHSIRLATPGSIPTLQSMGFNGPTWDCFINHYVGFLWNNLAPEVMDSYVTLGWTELLWNSESAAPASEALSWDELSDAERAAAEKLCYFDKLWDRIPLTEWEGTTASPSGTTGIPSRNKDDTNPSGAHASHSSALACVASIWIATWIH